MALPRFRFAIRPSIDAFAGTVVGEEGLLLEGPAPQVWDPVFPFVVAWQPDERVRGVPGCFWAMASAQVMISTQPSNVAILLIVDLLGRGVPPLVWNGSDYAAWFQKICGTKL